MPNLTIAFAKPQLPTTGTLVVLVGEDAALTPLAAEFDRAAGGALARAMAKAGFKAKG